MNRSHPRGPMQARSVRQRHARDAAGYRRDRRRFHLDRVADEARAGRGSVDALRVLAPGLICCCGVARVVGEDSGSARAREEDMRARTDPESSPPCAAPERNKQGTFTDFEAKSVNVPCLFRTAHAAPTTDRTASPQRGWPSLSDLAHCLRRAQAESSARQSTTAGNVEPPHRACAVRSLPQGDAAQARCCDGRSRCFSTKRAPRATRKNIATGRCSQQRMEQRSPAGATPAAIKR